VETQADVYIVARIFGRHSRRVQVGIAQVLATVDGAKLDGSMYKHPFLERPSLGILGDHVTLEQAPAPSTPPRHGQEDFDIGRQYGSRPIARSTLRAILSRRGRRGPATEEIIGKTVWEANPIIVDLLGRVGALRRPKDRA